MKTFTIAIDGPVGAGKSSIADGVAEKLGILHLDTGAMYRAFAWKALQEGISVEDEGALTDLANRCLPEVRFEKGTQRTLIAGEDVTDKIRTPEISMAASTSSKFAPVRKAMVARQQEIARSQSILMDGRDIGTVVLPKATLKIYLTASPEVRARRRYDEMIAKGMEADYETVLSEVVKRDEQDMNREVTPLKAAEDAFVLDSSRKNPEQVQQEILRLLALKQGKRPELAEETTTGYKFTRAVFRFVFTVLFPVEYHGVENAQLSAPFIVISNHNSALDPLMIALPFYSYQVRFLGKKELSEIPFVKWILCGWLKMIPIDRHKMDMAAIRASLKTLKENHPLGIFPEGTRHKETVMEELENGTAMLALRSDVPVVPVLIDGKPRLFRKLPLYIGKPFDGRDLLEKGLTSEACNRFDDRIRGIYRDMLKEIKNP